MNDVLKKGASREDPGRRRPETMDSLSYSHKSFDSRDYHGDDEIGAFAEEQDLESDMMPQNGVDPSGNGSPRINIIENYIGSITGRPAEHGDDAAGLGSRAQTGNGLWSIADDYIGREDRSDADAAAGRADPWGGELKK